jgi:hypothetical protein
MPKKTSLVIEVSREGEFRTIDIHSNDGVPLESRKEQILFDALNDVLYALSDYPGSLTRVTEAVQAHWPHKKV